MVDNNSEAEDVVDKNTADTSLSSIASSVCDCMIIT